MFLELCYIVEAVDSKKAEKPVFDRQRVEHSLASGKPIELPRGLSREEKRRFIMSNR